jgi:hypothetical protein
VSTEPSADGPTPRAVALARAWLWLAGMVWLIVGVIMLASSHDSSIWLAVLVVVFALVILFSRTMGVVASRSFSRCSGRNYAQEHRAARLTRRSTGPAGHVCSASVRQWRRAG